MNIMRQNDRPPGIQLSTKLLETAGDQLGAVILVVLRVDTGSNNMIPEIGHSRKHLAVDGEEWRSHIPGDDTNNLLKRILELCHLSHDGVVVERREREMAPANHELVSKKQRSPRPYTKWKERTYETQADALHSRSARQYPSCSRHHQDNAH